MKRLRLLVAVLGAALLLVCGSSGAVAAEVLEDFGAGAAAEGASSRAAAAASVLGPGESLAAGKGLVSPNGRFRLDLQRSGNLVLVDTTPSRYSSAWFRGGWPIGVGLPGSAVVPAALWDSGTVAAPNVALTMLPDGNLVLAQSRSEASPVWQSRTSGFAGAHLHVSDDGNVIVSARDGRALWMAGTSMPEVGMEGKAHIVYQRAAQRVWLIEADGTLFDTYPVSGRVTNPLLGSYSVYSKSPLAGSSGGAVTMAHMVRFAYGAARGIPVGFHAIPRDHAGEPLQTLDELGHARSAGCVRQQDSKALQLYEWAPIGTPVVVTDSA